jgi:DeoR family glycerol-3-phosphate regulon repressor
LANLALRRLTSRQERILTLTEAQGFVTIESLSEAFSVSAQTVRRDIIALSDAGLLQRFHGGAGPAANAEPLRLDHARKLRVGVEEKRRVAAEAAARAPAGGAIFLDVGTTMEVTAEALNAREGLTVFTSSMRVALALDAARHEVRVLGGRVAGRDGSLCGEEVMLALGGLRIDVAMIGCSAIEPRGRVMDFDLDKIAVKKAAMRAAERSFLLAAPSKRGRTARAEIGWLADFAEVLDGCGAAARAPA